MLTPADEKEIGRSCQLISDIVEERARGNSGGSNTDEDLLAALEEVETSLPAAIKELRGY